jgi:hypothetical protein
MSKSASPRGPLQRVVIWHERSRFIAEIGPLCIDFLNYFGDITEKVEYINRGSEFTSSEEYRVATHTQEERENSLLAR